MNWIQFGDRNSKFLHATTSRRRQNNNIFQLKDEHGQLVKGNDTILDHAFSHFQHIYGSWNSHNFELIMGLIIPYVTVEMNHDLCHPVFDDEFHSTMFQLRTFKAPGIDGFPGCFFQHH